MSDWTSPLLRASRDHLLATVQSYRRVAVAYSGGVDSAVVAQAAQLALGDNALAVTAVSDSLSRDELEHARSLAKQIGIRHRIIHTQEFANPNYTRNAPDRCYFCKSELYGTLVGLRASLHVDIIASGANLDDTGDHRPGLKAAEEHNVRHPLIECRLTKQDVRALAHAWGLPVWDKPASPCLSSRIAYGEEVTPERVRMVEAAEKWLREHDLNVLRVRFHKGPLARIEVPVQSLPRLVDPSLRSELITAFRQLGFAFITLDLEGFRSGSQNAVIPAESLTILAPNARGS